MQGSSDKLSAQEITMFTFILQHSSYIYMYSCFSAGYYQSIQSAGCPSESKVQNGPQSGWSPPISRLTVISSPANGLCVQYGLMLQTCFYAAPLGGFYLECKILPSVSMHHCHSHSYSCRSTLNFRLAVEKISNV